MTNQTSSKLQPRSLAKYPYPKWAQLTLLAPPIFTTVTYLYNYYIKLYIAQKTCYYYILLEAIQLKESMMDNIIHNDAHCVKYFNAFGLLQEADSSKINCLSATYLFAVHTIIFQYYT